MQQKSLKLSLANFHFIKVDKTATDFTYYQRQNFLSLTSSKVNGFDGEKVKAISSGSNHQLGS
jgi:hypothetical protein